MTRALLIVSLLVSALGVLLLIGPDKLLGVGVLLLACFLATLARISQSLMLTRQMRDFLQEGIEFLGKR